MFFKTVIESIKNKIIDFKSTLKSDGEKLVTIGKEILVILKIIWQFPQSIIAILAYLFLKYVTKNPMTFETYKNRTYIIVKTKKIYTCVSLGQFVFLTERSIVDDKFVKDHEFGHTIQSLIFGPLYLIVIGVPSFVLNFIGVVLMYVFDSKEFGSPLKYYARWPENWADSLGGVKRR